MFSSSSSTFFLQPSFLPTDFKAFKVTRLNAYCSRKIVARCTTTENRAASSSSNSLYEVLGISMSASCHEIKAAYRKLARTCHPDVVAMNQKETSASEFMRIHSAYSTLSDPNKRAEYDRQIYRNKRPLHYSSLTSENIASMSGYNRRYAQSGMKWETDQCW